MSFEQFKEYGTGCCINCGYLGKKDKEVHTSECYEASTFERISGTLLEHMGAPVDPSKCRPRINTIPWCFVGQAYIHDEAEARFAEMERNRDKTLCIYDVISKSRACPTWYPWREFASPKEHFEEFKMQQLEQDRRKFELKLEGINRQERKRTNCIMIWLAVAAIVFAIAEVAAGLMGITSDSWILRFFR